MQVLKLALKFILTVIGITFIGSLPSLFSMMSINITQYFIQDKDTFLQILQPENLVYVDNGVPRALFPKILGPYFYSMEIFFTTFFVALIFAILLTYITCFLPMKFKKAVKFLAFIGESLPDVFVIIIFQLVIIWIYSKTHVLLVNIAGVWGDHIFLLPVICLCILPIFLLYRILILATEEELEKDYIELAKSKGIHQHALLLHHIFRNLLVTIFFYSKTIIWVMLSNLLIFEYLFNITGITLFMYEHPVPTVFTISLIMIFIPIFLLFTLGQLLIQVITGQKVDA